MSNSSQDKFLFTFLKLVLVSVPEKLQEEGRTKDTRQSIVPTIRAAGTQPPVLDRFAGHPL